MADAFGRTSQNNFMYEHSLIKTPYFSRNRIAKIAVSQQFSTPTVQKTYSDRWRHLFAPRGQDWNNIISCEIAVVLCCKKGQSERKIHNNRIAGRAWVREHSRDSMCFSGNRHFGELLLFLQLARIPPSRSETFPQVLTELRRPTVGPQCKCLSSAQKKNILLMSVREVCRIQISMEHLTCGWSVVAYNSSSKTSMLTAWNLQAY